MVDCGSNPEHRHPDLLRGRGGLRLRRQLRGQDPQARPQRGHGEVHRLRDLLREVPGQGVVRVRRGHRQAAGDLCPLPAGGAERAGHRPRALPLLHQEGACRICEKLCPSGAIDYEQEDEILTEKFGAIVMATGFDLWDHSAMGEYGYGKYPGRHLRPAVRAADERLRPDRAARSCGRPTARAPKTVVFLSCVGSRDDEHGYPYCSKVCCMYNAKQALLLKDKLPRRQGLRFLYGHPRERQGLRGVRAAERSRSTARPTSAAASPGSTRGRRQLVVRGADTLLGKPVEIAGGYGGAGDRDGAAARTPRRWPASWGSRPISINWFTEAHPEAPAGRGPDRRHLSWRARASIRRTSRTRWRRRRAPRRRSWASSPRRTSCPSR